MTLIQFISFLQLSSNNNVTLPALCQAEKLTTSDSLINNDNIEMQPMNDNSTSSPACRVPHIPLDCFPNLISKHFTCCGKCIPKSIQERWTYFRSLSHYVVENQYFECLIIISILASSTTLVSEDSTIENSKNQKPFVFSPLSIKALEDVNTRQQPRFSYVLSIFDKIFTVIFTIELILKWFAYGITNYFSNGWNKLDFVIVVVSVLGAVLDIFGIADIPAFKSMRTLRALRPLKALSRFEGIRV